jgi:hypothetical protein
LPDPHLVFHLSKHNSIEEARSHLWALNDAGEMNVRAVASEVVAEPVANRILLGYRGGKPKIRTTSNPQFRKLLWLAAGAGGFFIAQSSDDPGIAAVLGFVSGIAVMVAVHIWYEKEWDW